MTERVLVPVDASEHADKAADLAFELFPDATIVLLHVINPAEAGFNAEATIPTFPEGWYEQRQAETESLLDDFEDRAGAVVTERRVEVGQPTKTTIETIDEEDIDHVVMGSHGRQGVSRLLLGSVAEQVIRRSPVPVTVAR